MFPEALEGMVVQTSPVPFRYEAVGTIRARTKAALSSKVSGQVDGAGGAAGRGRHLDALADLPLHARGQRRHDDYGLAGVAGRDAELSCRRCRRDVAFAVQYFRHLCHYA